MNYDFNELKQIADNLNLEFDYADFLDLGRLSIPDDVFPSIIIITIRVIDNNVHLERNTLKYNKNTKHCYSVYNYSDSINESNKDLLKPFVLTQYCLEQMELYKSFKKQARQQLIEDL